MCGITGWVAYDKDLETPENVAMVAAMTQTMISRGPDGGGVWTSPHAALGHRRLALIDVDNGQQPMVFNTSDTEVALTFSGEVYNYKEVRAELRARGHVFRTNSDTEVVLKGYLEWGPDVATHLRGMFAYAIWDSRNQKLVMTRDRLGIKPLYYQQTPDGVLFGSESKAILAHKRGSRAWGLDEIRELLSRVRTPGKTIWRDIAEVKPGCTVIVSQRGIKQQPYWTLRAREHTDDFDTTVECLRAMLKEVVRLHLVADGRVRVASLLSGGVDSSVLSALAAQQLSQPLLTYSLGFAGQGGQSQFGAPQTSEDEPYALKVAEFIRSLHSPIRPTAEALLNPDLRSEVIKALEFPRSDAGRESTLYLLFLAIQGNAKAVLSGEGADELFGGYRSFNEESVGARTFPWLAEFAAAEKEEHRLIRPELLAELELETYIADQYQTATQGFEATQGESQLETQMRKARYLHLTRFVRQLVDQAERIGMANGVEVRVPFLDHQLVEYAYSIPWGMQSREGVKKTVLREAGRGLVPESVLQRPKSGFPANPDISYLTALQKSAQRLLSHGSPTFDLVSRDVLRLSAEQDAAHLTFGGRQHLGLADALHQWTEQFTPELVREPPLSRRAPDTFHLGLI